MRAFLLETHPITLDALSPNKGQQIRLSFLTCFSLREYASSSQCSECHFPKHTLTGQPQGQASIHVSDGPAYEAASPPCTKANNPSLFHPRPGQRLENTVLPHGIALTTMDQLVDEPLPLDQPSFRLVRLIHGTDSAKQLELFQASIYDADNAMEYGALSYTWGNAGPPNTLFYTQAETSIYVNSSPCTITPNLSEALRNLRYEFQDRILWIDAICIDQGNHTERGHQVRQMPAIYENASR